MTSKKTKVERYGWSDPGERPEFKWIHKNDLLIDETYQRPADEAHLLNIAREFKWDSCGVFLVSQREGGLLFVYDGGHRLEALRRRDDITEVPCFINHSSLREEARAYDRVNNSIRIMVSLGKFKARLAGGDPIALFIDSLAKQSGCRIPKDKASTAPDAMNCISKIYRLVQTSRPVFEVVYPLANAVCSGRPFHEAIIGGFFFLETRLNASGTDSLKDRRWQKRVLAIGMDALLEAAGDAVRFEKMGGDRVKAIGFLREINKGLRTERLVVDLSSEKRAKFFRKPDES